MKDCFSEAVRHRRTQVDWRNQYTVAVNGPDFITRVSTKGDNNCLIHTLAQAFNIKTNLNSVRKQLQREYSTRTPSRY